MNKTKESYFKEITYQELGCYVGNKAVISVSADWLDSIKSTIEVHKECTKCNKHLPLQEFNNDKRRLLGKRSQCRSCYKEANPTSTKPIEDVPKIEYVLTDFNA